MSTGKYIPPPLRNKNRSTVSEDPPPEDSSYSRHSSSNSVYRTSYNRSRDSSRPYYSPNSYNSGYSHYDSYNSYGARRNYGSRYNVNSLGFHGDMRPNPELEREIFDDSKHVTEGINFDKYEDIPVEVGGNDIPEPVLEFDSTILPSSLMKNVQFCHFNKPTPVQKYGIAIGIAGRDLMACAQTGSGKTAGFLFPIIISMLKSGPRDLKEHSKRAKYYPTALVLAPTRELAVQIYEEARKFSYCTGIACSVCYGGIHIQETTRQLQNGCDILVGTPGRLVDLIERGIISFEGIKYLVLDEADRMLDMGFEPQIRNLVLESDMPLDRQTMMFSATFPTGIQRLAADFLNDYIFLTVGRVGAAARDITQKIFYVNKDSKETYLLRHLETLGEGKFLIFVATKRMADYLEDVLYRNNFPVSSIHGDKNQREREYALERFRVTKNYILVATDVAARGLDIPDVTYVINYDTPPTIDDYVHRIGRTGRAGNMGIAISYINEDNRNIAKDLYDLLYEAKQEIPSFLESLCSSPQRSFNNPRGYGNRFGGVDVRRGSNRQTHILNRGGNRSYTRNGGNAVDRLRNSQAAETTDAW